MRSSRSAPPDWLTARPYAHRGLHGPGRPENSRAAFLAAIEAGFGIELDVQVPADGAAVVLHDYALGRLAPGDARIDSLPLDTVRRTRLVGADETIPSLAEILALIGGRVPVLVEIKSPRAVIAPLCRAVLCAVAKYEGEAAVMSFNPRVVRWFKRHAPAVMRGLVVTEEDRRGANGAMQRRLSLWHARPHFLAYDVRDLPSRFAAASGLPVLTWTVRSDADEARAHAYADQIIHERPALR